MTMESVPTSAPAKLQLESNGSFSDSEGGIMIKSNWTVSDGEGGILIKSNDSFDLESSVYPEKLPTKSANEAKLDVPDSEGCTLVKSNGSFDIGSSPSLAKLLGKSASEVKLGGPPNANRGILMKLNNSFDLGSSPYTAKLPAKSASEVKLADLGAGTTSIKIARGDFGYILEDVPHFTDYLPDLPTYPNPLQDHPAYSVVKQYFVNVDDTVAQKIVVHKSSPRGTHFRRAGPRQRVYFESDEVRACIVTCGGLCPGLNTVIREIVCGLSDMYGVTKFYGIEGGYKGFYARNLINLTRRSVGDIHKRGGTILGTSRGGHVTSKIVDSIQHRGINQVYIIGGDGTQKGASAIYEEIRKRGLKVAVAGIPKTIDNDVAVIDKSFGFDTAVEEAQRAINAAHVEAESVENGIGLVKLMGRYSGFIAMYATLASRDVVSSVLFHYLCQEPDCGLGSEDCCLIPESPFHLEGKGGLLEYVQKCLKENGHMVIVVAEGAGQDLIAESLRSMDQIDASGNKLLLDVGLWLSEKIKDYLKSKKMAVNLKYIDPTYMIRAIPSNASDNVYCTLLAHSAIHGAMAGYTGFTVGPVNGRHAYIPFYRITEKQKKVVITDRMWARLLSSTNQPSFLSQKHVDDAKRDDEPILLHLLDEQDSDNDHALEGGIHQHF